MPQATLERVTIDYRVLGPDDSPHPPVLFVHGILVDHRLWLKVAERLADNGFRCILPNLPLGSHTVPVDPSVPLTPATVAEMVHELIGVLDLHDVTLVGNDTGGGLCQLLVDAHPDDVGRLVLTNCDAFEKFPPFPFNAVFSIIRGPKTIGLLSALMKIPALRRSPLGFGLLLNPVDDALTSSWVQPIGADPRIAANLVTLLRAVENVDLVDVATRLPRFTKPVTLVWGMADRCFTPALGRRLAAVFPNATMVEVPGARTFVALDAPAAVVDAITAKHPSESNGRA
jgi:pimeloyl-ACP methyl ester carboxylesterase